MTVSSTAQGHKPKEHSASGFHVITGAAVFNLMLIALSFVPWFAGTTQHPGYADKLFQQLRFGGFRADSCWLALSSGCLFVLLFVCIAARSERAARVAGNLTMVELAAFLVLVVHSLTSGLLYMG